MSSWKSETRGPGQDESLVVLVVVIVLYRQ